MKIAITGANGFVGANLAGELIDKGYDVKALYYNRKNALEKLKLQTVKGNILDKKLMEDFLKDVDVVFHAAAKISIGKTSFDELYKTNVKGTQTVFKAAKLNGVKTFVHFSSIHALKLPEVQKPCSETCKLALDSTFLYDRTKAMAQQWLMKQKVKGMKTVILNPTAILGPNDFHPSLIGRFIVDVMNKKLPALLKGGYDWVDIRDVTHAAVSAMEKGKNGEFYILSGQWESLINITKIMENLSGEKYNIAVYPLWLAQAGLPFLWLWSKLSGKTPLYTSKSLKIINQNSRQISAEKAKKELGFSSRPLENTIKDTMEWFKQNNYA